MTESSVTTRLVPPEAFARTYDRGDDVDPWAFVQRYREARLRWENDREPREIAEEFDTSLDQLRDWFGPDTTGVPLIVRELDIARRRGWVSIDQGTGVFRGLNVLVASVFSTGSIDPETYEPRFPVNSIDDIDRVAWAIDRVGLQYAMHRDSEEERAREVRPINDGSILGRVLVVLDAPVQGESAQAEELPTYLRRVSRDHRLAFARTYLESRVQLTRERKPVTIREDRTTAFMDELAQFLSEVAGADVKRRDSDVVVSADAAHALGAIT